MEILAQVAAAVGLGLSAYAVLETEAHEVGRRIAFGVLGMSMFVLVVLLT